MVFLDPQYSLYTSVYIFYTHVYNYTTHYNFVYDHNQKSDYTTLIFFDTLNPNLKSE